MEQRTLQERVFRLKCLPEERAIILADYMIENNATVRQAAKQFDISKSTVHKDITERLKYMNPALHAQVRGILEYNKAQRHIRGGLATQKKYIEEAKERKI